MTLHALRKENLANNIHVARDGEEALEFLFCNGKYSGRGFNQPPRLILLDLKLPKVDGMEAEAIEDRSSHTQHPCRDSDLVKRKALPDSRVRECANSYIQKPVDFDQFRETVKKAGFYWLLINQPPMAAVAELR